MVSSIEMLAHILKQDFLITCKWPVTARLRRVVSRCALYSYQHSPVSRQASVPSFVEQNTVQIILLACEAPVSYLL